MKKISWIRKIYIRLKYGHRTYEFRSFEVDVKKFKSFDEIKYDGTPTFALFIPQGVTKNHKKWYQFWKPKNMRPKYKYTDNSDGSQTWEVIK